MLFNSYLFLFLFLPVTLLGYHLIGKSNHPRIVIIWLVNASLLFYAWANPIYMALIIGSVMFNYTVGIKLAKLRSSKGQELILISGVTFNIMLLVYFKYANFFINNTNALFGSSFHLNTIILPLAISFLTLQQIAYLVDVYRGEPREHGFWEYCLFVTFFPKLLAGPIVRLKEMMPQIVKDYRPSLTSQNMAVGLTTLFLGLFKKVILADNIGAYVTPVFDAAAQGTGISFFNSWSGALGYSFQLYFDFSGYTDMAIGLGLIFGIRLPLNFYSPYKAKSIIDFWRRWHMTLSSFIRDYIYIPLGGNRRGLFRQIIYLMAAMIIAGIWHGAGWTFIIWGALHGLYLAINHGWRRLQKILGFNKEISTRWGTAVSTLFTFIAVTVAWVFFRADSVSAAIVMFKSMMGINGFHLPAHYISLGAVTQILERFGVSFDLFKPMPGIAHQLIIWILVSLFICWFLPNVQEYMSDHQPALDSFRAETKKPRFSWLTWKPSFGNSVVIASLASVAVLGLNQLSKFIYFKF